MKADLAKIERNLILTTPDSNKGTTALPFQSTEEANEVEIDNNDLTKKARIGVPFSDK